MGKAKEVIKLVEEISKTITSADQVNVGDGVAFVATHANAGITGIVQDKSSDGTLVIRIGKAIISNVKPSEIVKVVTHPGVGNPTV